MSALPRSPQRAAPTRVAIMTVLVIIGALLVGSWITSMLPSLDRVGRGPFERHAKVGDETEFRLGTVRVDRVQTASTVEQFGKVAGTPGVWMVVDLHFTAAGEQRHLPRLALRDTQGRVFGGEQVLARPCGPAQPGITVTCALPLELPEDALPGAELLIAADPWTHDAPDDVIVVDLGIDDARAKELTTDPPALQLPEMRVGGA